MWLFFAAASAIFAGMTAILAKLGLKKVDSTLATAIRTGIVLIFACIMVFITGSYHTISTISLQSYSYLILSGLTTGASWLCYFYALRWGDVNKVVPVDKSSTIITMLLAFFILKEPITVPMLAGMIFIAIGTYLMIEKKRIESEPNEKKAWFFFAVASAIFAALTSILGKIGITGIESNLGTAIRTIVVLIMGWIIVWIQRKEREIHQIDKKSWIYLILSGIATGASWLCYYRALQDGPASIVVPIDKLSIIVTTLLAVFLLKEKLSKKAAAGLLLITAGTLMLLVK